MENSKPEYLQNKDSEQRQSEEIMRHAKERPKIYYRNFSSINIIYLNC